MGRYSYSQPFSSKADDIEYARLLQKETALYADSADTSHIAAVQYPEADDGIPRTCYCGGEPVLATAQTSQDPGRRYFTCPNVDDGDCHVWKWWDVAVTEEMSDIQTQVRLLKDQANESDQMVVKLEKAVGELARKKSWVTNGVPLVVSVVVLICMLVMVKLVTEKEKVITESLEELHRLKMRVSHL